jgi:hypothetical protein
MQVVKFQKKIKHNLKGFFFTPHSHPNKSQVAAVSDAETEHAARE